MVCQEQSMGKLGGVEGDEAFLARTRAEGQGYWTQLLATF